MIRQQPKTVETTNPQVKALLSQLWFALLVHWVFQGTLYMDKTERFFKLFLDGIFTVVFALVTKFTVTNLIVGFLVAHTINFIFNAQINVVLKNFGISRADKAKLLDYLNHFAKRVQHEPSVIYAATYGSLSRNELKDTSDLDIRLVRNRNFFDGIRSSVFVCLERTRALLSGVPLDIYVFDSNKKLSRMRSDEKAQVVKVVSSR